MEPNEYRAADPAGRANLKAAQHVPLPEAPDARYPLLVTTGRNVYHWHTRTKTGRSERLQFAAPEPWVELSLEDARAHGVDSGDWVELESRRGKVRMRVKVADILLGHAFVPFHYGDWDAEEGPPRAANALTRAGWDAVSKQPHFKFCAARLKKLKGGP